MTIWDFADRHWFLCALALLIVESCVVAVARPYARGKGAK